MTAKPSKTKKSKPGPTNVNRTRKPRLEKSALKLPSEEEEFRPPRIPKVLREENSKRKKKEVLEDDFDKEPPYTDDYDNTIYNIEY